MGIAQQIQSITAELPQGVQLVAVSKFHPIEALNEAYTAGQRIFGESRVQEVVQKQALMPDDVKWHFIGHLQTNKVRQLVPYVSLIHSVDSFKLLECINKEAKRIDRVVDVLLQLHVAKEETKFGFTCEDCASLYVVTENGVFDNLKNVRVCGVMGMATNTDDEMLIRHEFKQIKSIFDILKSGYFSNKPYFKEISMGMSDDYHIAMEEGSTLIRIGTTIFGQRNY